MQEHLLNIKNVLIDGDTKKYKKSVENFYKNMSSAIRTSFLR